MKQIIISISISITCLPIFGQVKVNPGGKFFNYNGIKIYYEDTGAGEPLLLLHNFIGNADQWKPYVETYSKQFRTIAIDMIGHGRSDFHEKDSTFLKPGRYAKIVLALLDSLKLYKVNAIGASSGGITLLHLNTWQPGRFKSVITIGAQIYFSEYWREWVRKTGLNQLMEYAKPHGPGKQLVLAKEVWQTQHIYGDPSFTPDILNTIKANWLIVQGDNDEGVPLQQALDLHQYITNSRLWIVPNGGHLPHLNPDFQPEFLKMSLEFLTGKWGKKN